MNIDYVREVVNDRDIDIPFARASLVKQAGLELRAVAEVRPVSALLWGAYMRLIGSVDAVQVGLVVNDLCRVLNDSLMNAEDVPKPGSFRSPALIPGPHAVLAETAAEYDRIAAILRSLDLLSWVMAYDEIRPPVFEEDELDDETVKEDTP